jgi:hypothetical protein
MEQTLIVPCAQNFIYDKDGIFFKDRVYRRDNESGAEEHASSQIIYINDTIIMNGLTFFLNKKNSCSEILELEQVILKMYADTFFGNVNKTMNFVMNNDISNLVLESNEGDDTTALYITGVWDNASGIGLEYKWIKQFTHR